MQNCFDFFAYNVHLSSAMPPSITYGSDANKSCPSENDPQSQKKPEKPIPTIDLSNEVVDDDDLQKAIALSLQDQQEQIPTVPGISAEDHQVSRALEASLKESRPQTVVDNLDPHERKRRSCIPVGLKNIGNSCWFNVVIQPLVHIPGFRDLIFNYDPSVVVIEENRKDKYQNIVVPLRQLFALLVGSDQRYIDPAMVVNIFQNQEMQKDAQQDVCEFIHKLLERLEVEYQEQLKHQEMEKESSDCFLSKESNFNNPIMKLFYGQSFKELSEADGGPKYETFGQYPLQVMNYKNIHQSILASMSKNVMNPSHDNVSPTEQNTWFKILPPVLTFSLSRYEYSLEKQRAEKVHNKFEFPQFLYMDRYMEHNKDLVKKKHFKVSRIKEDLNSLVRTLDKYQKFGSGSCKYPLCDILKYTLEFAQTNSKIIVDDVSNSVPSPSKMEIDAVDNGDSTDVEMGETSESRKISDDEPDKAETISTRVPSPSKKMRIMPPTPSSMNANELLVLQSCLPRWQQEVEEEVEKLQKSIANLERQLDEMYDEPHFQKISYRLHAVVVHEGQASGGHYWVYIFDFANDSWMKFNDIQVCPCKWPEVLQDSIGGQNNASAYCLMYIDENRFETLFPNPRLSIDNLLERMPIDLQELVKNENLFFLKELQEWAKKLQHKTAVVVVPATAPNSPATVEDQDMTFFIEVETMLSHNASIFLNSETNKNTSGEIDNNLNTFLTKEITRQRSFADQKSDGSTNHDSPALLDLGVYMLKNGFDNNVLMKWYCCDVLSQKLLHTQLSPRVEQIKCEVERLLLNIITNYSQQLEPVYKAWKRDYKLLLECVWYVVNGYQLYSKRKYDKALTLLNESIEINNQLGTQQPQGPCKTIDKKILSKCMQYCLIEYNDLLIKRFVSATSEKDTWDVSAEVTNFILPGLCQISTIDLLDDSKTIAKVRANWCDLLEPSEKYKSISSASLSQILEGVLSEPNNRKFKSAPIDVPRLPGVLCLYKQFADTCKNLMDVKNSAAQTSDL